MANWLEAFQMREGETVRGVLADYDAVALTTDELVMSLPDLDASQSSSEGSGRTRRTG